LEGQDDILDRVITGDESWVFKYDSDTKRQIAQRKTASSHDQKFPSVQKKSQTMLLTFYIREIFHYKFVPTGQTVNQVYYMDVLERLRERFRWKSPEIFANNSWILHHDNAPAHTALPLRKVLATKIITVLVHPAYSTDLAPNDFFLFPKVTKILKGRHFDDTDDIRNNTTAALKVIPQNQFQICFEGWTSTCHWCVASQGVYFEGDHGGIQQ